MKCACFAAFLLCGCATAQQFEVATIKPSSLTPENSAGAGIHIDGAMVRYIGIDLKLLIGFGWGLKNYQIVTPDWMTTTRWDINAKIPDGVDLKQSAPMLQKLLIDRFEIRSHRETRDIPVYALIVSKGGSKLKESAGDNGNNADGSSRSIDVGASPNSSATVVKYNNGATMTIGNNQFAGHKLSMQTLADALARFADRPVIDATGLSGVYDFTLEFSPEDFRAMMIRNNVASGVMLPPEVLKLADASSGDTLFSAIEKLGLKLERRTAPVETLIVDEARRNPTDN